MDNTEIHLDFCTRDNNNNSYNQKMAALLLSLSIYVHHNMMYALIAETNNIRQNQRWQKHKSGWQSEYWCSLQFVISA